MAGVKFPPKGIPSAELKTLLHDLKYRDMSWKNCRAFSTVFMAGDDFADMVRSALGEYAFENGLSPFAFPTCCAQFIRPSTRRPISSGSRR